MRIRTVSGSTYTLVNGRITREAKCNPYLPPELAIPLFESLVCTVLTPAREGERFVFRTIETGVITTSSVVSVR